MKRIPLLLAALVLYPSGLRAGGPVAADEDAGVFAAWRSFSYTGPQYDEDGCAYAKEALDRMLLKMRAEEICSVCSYEKGLSASWKALMPMPGSPREAVSSLLSRVALQKGDWLAGLPEAGADMARSGSLVKARWINEGFTLHIAGGGPLCEISAGVIGWWMDAMPLRNASSNIFCQGSIGTITVNFDYLAAE